MPAKVFQASGGRHEELGKSRTDLGSTAFRGSEPMDSTIVSHDDETGKRSHEGTQGLILDGPRIGGSHNSWTTISLSKGLAATT